jgi:hypothetical protein
MCFKALFKGPGEYYKMSEEVSIIIHTSKTLKESLKILAKSEGINLNQMLLKLIEDGLLFDKMQRDDKRNLAAKLLK